MWQKFYQVPILGTLDISSRIHQKQQFQLVETLMFFRMQKINSIPNFFLNIVKILQTCYFENIENA